MRKPHLRIHISRIGRYNTAAKRDAVVIGIGRVGVLAMPQGSIAQLFQAQSEAFDHVNRIGVVGHERPHDGGAFLRPAPGFVELAKLGVNVDERAQHLCPAQLQTGRVWIGLEHVIELAFDDREDAPDGAAGDADEILELCGYLRDDGIGFVDGDAKNRLGALALGVCLLRRAVCRLPVPERKPGKQNCNRQPDAGILGGAPIGCGKRLSVAQPAFLLFPLALEPFKPRALLRGLALPALAQIVARIDAEVARKIAARSDSFRIFESSAGMIEPIGMPAVRGPIARRTLDALERRERRKVFFQPAAQKAPLPQQRVVRGLNRNLDALLVRVSHGHAVGREQALLDQHVDQRFGLCWNVREPCDAAARGRGLGVDARKQGNKPATQESKPRGAIARNGRIAIGGRECPFDRRLDRAPNAAKRLVIRKLERSAPAVFETKLLQREGEERKRVAAAPFFNILKQLLREPRLDGELAPRLPQARRGPFDHGLIGPARHGQQRKCLLPHAGKRLGGLQPVVGIRADGKQRNDVGVVLAHQLADQRKEHFAFGRALAEEQLFRLIDREHERRPFGPGFLGQHGGENLVDQHPQQRA